MKIYLKQLSTSGIIYSVLFKRVKGFSGTLWNAEAFPRLFSQIFASDTMVRTLTQLWEKSAQAVTTIPTPTKSDKIGRIEELVSHIYKNREGSFADIAGIFRGIDDNEAVAREMLKYQKEPIEGVAYFSKDNRWMVLTRGQPKGVPLEQSGLSKDQIVAYWNQKNTTGQDIKLGVAMTAPVSIGQHTMIRDLIQGVWRLRGLEKGQKVDFVIMEEDRQIIRNTLIRITGKPIGEELTLGDLLLYTMYNQAVRQGDDNHRSLTMKMKSLLLEKVVETIVDPSLSMEDMLTILNETQELFSSISSENPYEQYGRPIDIASSKEVVGKELDALLQGRAMKAFSNHPALLTRYSAQQIEKDLRTLAQEEMSKLPDQLVTSNYDTEVALHTQRSLKAETKTETQKETETQRQVEFTGDENKYSVPRPVIQWDRKDLFERATYYSTPVAKFSSIQPASTSQLRQRLLTPVLTVSDALANDEATKEYADLFDLDLFATLNLMPVYPPEPNTNQPIYHPFSRYQDIISNALVIEDKETGGLRFILADQEDASHIDRLLMQDAREPSKEKREVKICLYNLVTGIVTQGSDPFDRKRLDANPQLIRLRTQSKFFGGALTYTPEEIAYLRLWFKEKGPERMYALFYSTILQKNASNRAAFPYSDIAKVFTEVGIR